ncbi:MAG TPA: hypothetical protein VNL38_03370 [Candidatus Nitrosotenuis sp.]|nr:hypothetical protein [Candidatus Nitrosotenuis sp.]
MGMLHFFAGWSGLLLAGVLAGVLSFSVTNEQESLSALRRRVQQQTDPVQKAKAVPRVGDMHIEQFRRETSAENYDAALRVIQEYRDLIKDAHESLKKSGRNADKNPNGFKQLEIHLRQSITKLARVILSIPQDLREDFETIRKELEMIDKELVEAIFPRQPAKK